MEEPLREKVTFGDHYLPSVSKVERKSLELLSLWNPRRPWRAPRFSLSETKDRRPVDTSLVFPGICMVVTLGCYHSDDRTSWQTQGEDVIVGLCRQYLRFLHLCINSQITIHS